ncbi:VirB4 family type IV secretion/conjugal transfer ATPase [Rickettsia endosymbiont of Cardiosporidium cionae]|uniref:VirB4 family type IV secretion/conjugal transfer ATPase n=1 Tax=Rickettsia endosymbiont of Cardiosporidium cionae TaxID=2777155 RepID=UPI001895A907|nr:hypothetical protein [Rickettsia endosymbiont of Cardiosporidium cionae]KAF8818224.1 VirB4 family type IV secretion/conjugal transfer ATPase [Rickettsia endosymbiont of Cardiosporidium cionae]
MPYDARYKKLFYSQSAKNFIPIVGYFNDCTLLTKNSELIQTIKISGPNKSDISNIANIRADLRSILSGFDNPRLVFWIHNLYKQIDYDNKSIEYDSLFFANFHKYWVDLNDGSSHMLNEIYLTIVYCSNSFKLDIGNFNNYFLNNIANSINHNLVHALKKITEISDSILLRLKHYDVSRLSIKKDLENEICFSENLFIYKSIIQLDQSSVPELNFVDMSEYLGEHSYAISNNKIEVVSKTNKSRFAAILSIKECTDLPDSVINKILQSNVNMIITEIFYSVVPTDLSGDLTLQSYILGLSHDTQLLTDMSLTNFSDKNHKDSKLCYQQLSLMVIADTVELLEYNVYILSEIMADVGIIVVREDINLEKIFWSQLPGNFKFVQRKYVNYLRYVALFASIPTLPQLDFSVSPLGEFITLFRTKDSVPYLFNFHDQDRSGSNFIIGTEDSGKSFLLNLLLIESYKFLPKILYITNNREAFLFANLGHALWIDNIRSIFNPLMIDSSEASRDFLLEFFKIIMGYYKSTLETISLELITKFVEEILLLPVEERLLSLVIDRITKNNPEYIDIKKRLFEFTSAGKFYQIFESDIPFNIENFGICILNLEQFGEELFSKQYFPQDQSLLHEFNEQLNILCNVKMAIIWSVTHLYYFYNKDSHKIIAIDNIGHLVDIKSFSTQISRLINTSHSYNSVFIATLNLYDLYLDGDQDISNLLMEQVATKILLPMNRAIDKLDIILNITKEDCKMLLSLDNFIGEILMIKNGKTVILRLPKNFPPYICNILSSDDNTISIFNQFSDRYKGVELENWVYDFFNELNKLDDI